MLTKRPFLLTLMVLLTSYAATAQSVAATGPKPTDILSWLTWFVAAVVLLMAVMSAVSLAEASRPHQSEASAAEPAATPEHAVAAERIGATETRVAA